MSRPVSGAEHRALRREDEDERRRQRAELGRDRRRGRAPSPGTASTRGRARWLRRLRRAGGHGGTTLPRGRRQRLKIRALLARSAAWVRLRTLIFDMIAAMWVLTVASAIESS